MRPPLVAQRLRALGASSLELARGLRRAPACSVSSGAAGVAYFFYRLGREERDAELLTLAAAWIDRARRDAGRADAFPASTGASALYHRAPGVHCVDTLIALARSDDESARSGAVAFLRSARVRDACPDLATGRAGLLLGAAAILDASGARPPFDRASLLAMGDAERARLWRALDRLAPIAASRRFPALGIAHGWAGLLYATLRWSQSSARPLPRNAVERLAELARCGIVNDAGQVRWPTRSPGTSDDRASLAGWCNGVAGFVFLWTLAHEVTGDAGYLTLAHGAARTLVAHARAPGRTLSDLCCGAAGEAYALTCAYRHGGDRAWLATAQRLAKIAGLRGTKAPHRASLHHGDVGIALLQAELRRPETARMPLFERELTGASR